MSTTRRSAWKLGALRVLHAVRRPQHLRHAAEFDDVARPRARVVDGEAAVVRRMPVLRRHDERELRHERVGDGHDRVAVRHGERAAGHEVVLQVDEQQRAHRDRLLRPRSASPDDDTLPRARGNRV